jgi:hypothetical protein
MATAPDTSAPPGPLSLVNVVFWQVAGLAIGGLIPTSALAFLPASWLVLGPDGQWSVWVWGALCFAPFTAAIGGVAGTLIGVSDRYSAFRPRSRDATGRTMNQ